jgi:hypothetical protein
MPKPKGAPFHTGDERFEIRLVFDAKETAEIRRMTKEGDLLPDSVVLIWTRRTGGQWTRYTNGSFGSRIIGSQGLHGPYRSREIFSRDLGELKPWAAYLPGLRPAIEEAESNLPR